MSTSNPVFLLVYLLIIFSIPISVILIVFTSKARKKRKFKKTYGCSQEYYEQLIRLKDLYDHGILTTEEYEAKKKKFLGL